MKTLSVLLFAILLPAASIARDGAWYVSLEAGIPRGPVEFDSGYQTSGGVGMGLGLETAPHLEAMLDVTYHRFPINRSYFFDLAGVSDNGSNILLGGHTTALMALFNMRIRPVRKGRRLQPVLGVGVGLAGFTVHAARGVTSEWILEAPGWKETDLAARVTGGLEVKGCRGVHVFVEAGQVFIATTGSATRVGVVRCGLRFTPDVFRRGSPRGMK